MTPPRQGAAPAQLSLFEALSAACPPPRLPVDAALLAPVCADPLHAIRKVQLDGRAVAYTLKRVRRRTIGFMVGADGLSVSAPRWVGLGDIESALREKSTWILRKLAEQQERSRRLAAARIEWRDGATIPYLGEPLIVVVDERAASLPGGALLNSDAPALPGMPRLTLHVGLPHAATAAALREAVQAWLQREAWRIFEDRCRVYAQKLGVRHSRLRLSSAQTRWGSASADGTIRLNWRLVHFSMPMIDYVVAHELAHLREMNHSPRFWDVVRSVCPDYEQAREALKSGSVPMFD